ncbi:hypothetical protein PIB30_085632 [Stylosanthes scabra]|uniref:Uncharacterized protein n=1 Tax=Stylosanthes scabra TaxID=79078 RepID=A0ABU6YS41_9FABA|nr:hypothetical protein [Stylosanthes scabra]
MEPLQSIPYNLRSRGRVIGNGLLRLRRGVPVDNSSVKHHHRSCQKPCKEQKPRGPSIHSCPCEELGNQIPNHCETIEEENRQCRLWYMEKFRPQPLVAMQHYNKNLKEEEQYKVYDSKGQIMVGYDKVGFFSSTVFYGCAKIF